MSPETVGVLGIILLVVLLLCRMWIGLAMAFVGIFGFAILRTFDTAFATAGLVPFKYIAFYPITALPMFALMGVVLANTGVSGDLYNTANKWMGQFRGGLAIATVVACAALAAIMGTSVAEAVTMGKVAVPEMKKYNYADSFSTACVAAGSTIGILIPPSVGFILYGILTENSVGALFMAGVFPGILLSGLFIIGIWIVTWRNPKAGPPGPKTTMKEKVVSLKTTWSMLLLFILVLGGIYGGIFTPTEAGAIGAFGALMIALVMRRLHWKNFMESVREAAQVTAMVVVLMVGAYIFMKFLTVSNLTTMLTSFIGGLDVSPYVVLTGIIVLYIILGMFLDIMACIIITIPFMYPIILTLGFDPIWFGVIMVIMMEMGMITPPVGINVFAISGVSGVPIFTIFRGVVPFVIAMIVCVILITIFPQIALFLPSTM
ncbi:TRAP transporter large permease [Chloroflexota bacterium]